MLPPITSMDRIRATRAKLLVFLESIVARLQSIALLLPRVVLFAEEGINERRRATSLTAPGSALNSSDSRMQIFWPCPFKIYRKRRHMLCLHLSAFNVSSFQANEVCKTKKVMIFRF